MGLSNPSTPVDGNPNDFHSKMDSNDSNMHYPRGFRVADNGTKVVKDERGLISYPQIDNLPPSLDFVSGSASPPTLNDGDVYILTSSLLQPTVTDIEFQLDTVIRITFSGGTDLSSVTEDDFFIISTASNEVNNGRFVISDVNDGSDYIDIINPDRGDATADETSVSLASDIGFRDWDGAILNEWIRYNAADDLWNRIVPSTGVTCFLLDELVLYFFDGTNWTTVAGSGSAKISTGTYSGDGTTSRSIIGVGFLPKYVKIWERTTTNNAQVDAYETTNTIISDSGSGGAIYTDNNEQRFRVDRIVSLDVDGFTVSDGGTNSHPNQNTQVYNYMAIG